MSHFFQLPYCFSDFSTMLHVSIVHYFLLLSIIFHWMVIPHFVYPFTCWRTFELFPVLVIMNKTTINIQVQVLCVFTGVELLVSMVSTCLSHKKFIKFSKVTIHFVFPSLFCERSSYFTSSPTLGMVSLFSFSYSYTWDIESHCELNLYYFIPNNLLNIIFKGRDPASYGSSLLASLTLSPQIFLNSRIFI